jgi:hypothetical protein
MRNILALTFDLLGFAFPSHAGDLDTLASERIVFLGDSITQGGLMLGICFLREAPEKAIGADLRARKWGLVRLITVIY